MRTMSRTTAAAAAGLALCGLLWTAGPAQLAAAAGKSVKAGAAVVATTSVNVRATPSTSGAILGGLERGQRITAVGQSGGDWVAVRFDKATAYVSASYVNTTGKSLPAAPSKINASGTKITTTTLNVRKGAASSYGIAGTLAEGSKITVTGKFSGGYAQTVYSGHKRWVLTQYLARFGTSTSTTAPIGTPLPPTVPAPSADQGAQALAFAVAQLGKPYKFGATGPTSYDCSGLVQAAWKSVGVSLPRTTYQQYKSGPKIAKSELRAGDLVFFYGSSPSHVGIYAGDGKIVHAPRPGKKVEYIKISYMPYTGAVRPG